MKKSISELNYSELLNYANSNSLSDSEKDEVIDILINFGKYSEYNVYFLTITWLTINQREKLINSLLENCSEKVIYNFSVSLGNKLYESEVNYIFDKIYEFNDEDYVFMYIKEFFNVLKDNIDSIINKICKDSNYSLLFRVAKEYHESLESKIDYIASVISKSQSGYYMNQMLTYNISDSSKSLLLEEICKLDDDFILRDAITYLKNNLSNNDINNILSSYDRTLKHKIIESLLENSITVLSEENITSIIKIVFKTLNKDNIIYVIGKLYDYLTDEHIKLIIDLSEKTNNPEILFNVSELLKDKIVKNKEMVSSVGKSLSQMNSVYYMYKYLCEFKDIMPVSLKNELISRIIKSNEMKFIILVAVFVDIKLVEQIFKDKKSLFICAFGLNVFTLQELKDIKKMLKLDEEKPNIDNIPKKYKLTLNEDKNISKDVYTNGGFGV